MRGCERVCVRACACVRRRRRETACLDEYMYAYARVSWLAQGQVLMSTRPASYMYLRDIFSNYVDEIFSFLLRVPVITANYATYFHYRVLGVVINGRAGNIVGPFF